MPMALEGIRVVDLSRLAPGPYCSMLLADFGADVLMIEAAGKAADGPAARMGMMGDPEREAAFNALYRNKRSLGLNLKEARAREVFYRIVENADVVLEGFRPGVAKRLGVDYETVAPLKEGLIYCSLTGYGQTGPYASLAGHDINYSALGGGLGVTGSADGKPAIALNLLADFAGGGLFAAFAICSALVYRQRTGRGQYIDHAMSDGVLSLMTWPMSIVFGLGGRIDAGSWLLNGAAPWYNVYACADEKWISVGALEPRFYAALCRVLGCPQWVGDQYNSGLYPEMFEHYRRTFATQPRDAWMTALRENEACGMAVLGTDELSDDPHHGARGMIVEIDHATVGPVRQVGIAPKFSETPGEIQSTGPAVGEHTDDVLAWLGYAAGEIAELRREGIVG